MKASNKHTYSGLYDSRGSLTRYKRTAITMDTDGEAQIAHLLPREWVINYLAHGGTFDGMGVWGICPYASIWGQFPPAQVAGWLRDAHKNRADNLPSIKDILRWVEIHPTAALADLYRLSNGAYFCRDAKKWGWNPLSQGKSIFWCARQYRKPGALIKYADKYGKHPSREFVKFSDSNGPETPGNPGLWGYAVKCREKWNKRKWLKAPNVRFFNAKFLKNVPLRHTGQSTYPFHSRKAAEYAVTSKETMSLRNKLHRGFSRAELDDENTSIGRVFFAQLAKGGEVIGHNGHLITPRTLANGLNCAKIDGVWFVWRHSFAKHNEGKTLKAAVAAYQARKAVNGTDVSFSMVRAAKGYCLAGTKAFLNRAGLLHLYRLLQPFSCWEDLQSSAPELMDTVWQFKSRDVFAGHLD